MKTFSLGIVGALLLGGSALAADLSPRGPTYKAAAVAPAYSFSWTGCYVGGQAGIGAGHTTWRDTRPIGTIDATMTGQTANTDMSGGLVGGQVGCDYQFPGGFVIGAEGSFAAANISGTNMDQFNATWTLRSHVDGLGSATGRIGYAFDRVLFYARGGAAWAHNNFEIENTAILDGKPSATRAGWVIGGGVEWAFAPSVSVFLQADYYDFGGTNVSFVGDRVNPTPPFTVRTSQTIETVKFGVNYRFGGFGGAPVVAAY